jgi:hypothetical protein
MPQPVVRRRRGLPDTRGTRGGRGRSGPPLARCAFEHPSAAVGRGRRRGGSGGGLTHMVRYFVVSPTYTDVLGDPEPRVVMTGETHPPTGRPASGSHRPIPYSSQPTCRYRTIKVGAPPPRTPTGPRTASRLASGTGQGQERNDFERSEHNARSADRFPAYLRGVGSNRPRRHLLARSWHVSCPKENRHADFAELPALTCIASSN